MADKAITDGGRNEMPKPSEALHNCAMENMDSTIARAVKVVESVPVEVANILERISAKLAAIPESYRADLLAIHPKFMTADSHPLWHLLQNNG